MNKRSSECIESIKNIAEPSGHRRIVVLGAAGFLGSAMADHLARQGHEVVAFWRRPLPKIAKLPGIISVIGDLRDTWVLSDAIEGADLVYHFASVTHPSMFFNNPSAEYWEAFQPLMVLMETAARQRVKKIVFPSSGGTIYANSSEVRSEASATDPQSPYAIFKLAGEQLLRHAARQAQFSVDIFRIGNPYGPGQPCRPGQGVLPHWIESVHQQQPIKIFGDGSSERDYIYIDDVCRLMSLSCLRLDDSETFNLGTGRATTLLALLEQFRQWIPPDFPVEFLPGRTSDVPSIVLDPRRLLSQTSNFKFTALTEGLKRTLAHHRLLENQKEA